jgi:hypothetical protein
MRSHGRLLRRGAPALTALLLTCGCASIPGTFGQSSEPTPSPTRKPQSHAIAGPAPSANSVAPVTGPGPTPILPLNLAGPESPQDVISFQSQKLNAAEDERKLLAARLAQLEATLQDRDRAQAETIEEIREAREEFAHKLADVNKRCKLENTDLLERLRKTEKEWIEAVKENNRLKEKLPEPDGTPMEREPRREP